MKKVLLVVGCVAALCGTAQASPINLLTNGSFEAPALGSTAYVYPGNPNPALSGGYSSTANNWTYGGSALVNTSVGANAWYGGAPPAGYDGSQFAALQGDSTISQIFNAPSAGLANISWLSAGRPNFGSIGGDQTYDVLLNGSLIGSFSTTDGQAFTSELKLATLVAGINTLTFEGTDLTKLATDQTAFIDNVSVTGVPEPLTLSVFGAGLVGAAALRRRRKKVDA